MTNKNLTLTLSLKKPCAFIPVVHALQKERAMWSMTFKRLFHKVKKEQKRKTGEILF